MSGSEVLCLCVNGSRIVLGLCRRRRVLSTRAGVELDPEETFGGWCCLGSDHTDGVGEAVLDKSLCLKGVCARERTELTKDIWSVRSVVPLGVDVNVMVVEDVLARGPLFGTYTPGSDGEEKCPSTLGRHLQFEPRVLGPEIELSGLCETPGGERYSVGELEVRACCGALARAVRRKRLIRDGLRD